MYPSTCNALVPQRPAGGRLESAQPDSEIAELAARTWTNAGLLYSYEQKAQEATDSFSKALIFRMGTRDVVALASAHANFALSLIDVNNFHVNNAVATGTSLEMRRRAIAKVFGGNRR